MRFKFDIALLPIIVLIALNFVYFYPAFQGKSLVQDDIMLGKLKSKEIVDYRSETGEEPLWTNRMFSGMPTFQISTLYPNNWLTYIHKVYVYVLGKPSSIYIIGMIMLGFFLLLRSYSVDPWLSLAGGIAAGFSAFFIISFAAGHNAKVLASAFIAPTLMGVLLTLRGKRWLGFVMTALFVGLSVRSNHFQITFYSGIIILSILVVYAIQAFKDKKIKEFLIHASFLAGAAILGIGPNIGNLWTTMAYTQETMRGGHSALVSGGDEGQEVTTEDGLSFDYAMGWSMTKPETFNLFIPMFAGGGAREDYTGTEIYSDIVPPNVPDNMAEQYNGLIGSTMYWGESMTNGAYYVGAVIFFFFILAMVVIQGPTRQWVIASIVIALLLGWGRHLEGFNRFIFENLPLYNKFRVPSMSVVILCVIIPFFGILGLQRFLDLAKENKVDAKKKLMQALYISGGIIVFLIILGPTFFSFEGENDARMLGFWKQNNLPLDINQLVDYRISIMRSSAIKSLAFVLLAFGLLYAFLRDILKGQYVVFLVVGLVLVDMWAYDKDHLSEDSFVEQRNYLKEYAPTRADKIILQDNDPYYRVWNTTANLTSDSRTSYYHNSVGGYHGAKLARYQDLIDHQLSKGNQAAFNMLNAKYFIVRGNNGEMGVQQNPGAAGNAWYPNEVIWANGPNEEMNALSSFDAKEEVIVNSDLKDVLSGDIQRDTNVARSIQLTSYDPRELKYKTVNNGKDALAVFSEVWYDAPGQPWKLYVDGTETELFRVNYLLRGAVIPTGEHELVMRFEPKTYFLGEKIDLVFSILLFLVLGYTVYAEVKDRKKGPIPQE